MFAFDYSHDLLVRQRLAELLVEAAVERQLRRSHGEAHGRLGATRMIAVIRAGAQSFVMSLVGRPVTTR